MHVPAVVFLMLVFISCLFPPNVSGQEKKKINILNANNLRFNRKLGEVRRLLGEVRLEHDETYMNCDSAYLYQNTNVVEAYGNIVITRGDTLRLYGNYLKYTGDTRLAELRGDVKLIDKETTLTTNYLDFDLRNDLGYYYDMGNIYDGENNLSSRNGIYYSQTGLFHFQDSVVVVNPEYVIYADTMDYYTETKVTTFFGPTEIISDSSYIYCEYGWYDTENDISRFSRNALLIDRDLTIRGDSLFYDKNIGIGQAFGNVALIDTAQNIVIKGHKGFFQREPEYSVVSDSALFIQALEEGDSLYMHADTLQSRLDSTGRHKIMSAYYAARVFSEDLQASCDSLAYSFADSIIRFYGAPVIWTEATQLTSDFTLLRTRNRQADQMELYGSSFIISREDSAHYNQIKGKDMIGFFRDNKIYRVDVSGNGQTIYFPVEDSTIVGQNFAESSDIVLSIRDNRIYRIKMINEPDGILKPTFEIRTEETYLEGFRWLGHLRPRRVLDLFRKEPPEGSNQ
jgi:lipopolysaccharide export system protein LptA